ncbi:sigma-70 family RNA polymerase sigma factor [Anoxybacterium hadale]|uniref:Sigma-70 family RNA polymerase sigma factor n=1 Tax=Anoxybacterium hadale TaxID=3408580 RepID=A0ACD1ADT7_9FIRM|nr:sigma-70 family RNA polymerase sigma factor [Clostridiales bacterium]
MDRDILEQLYVRNYNSALLYTLSLCHSRETAEDIVSEAFVKAYLSLSDEHTSFQYWLLRVCKNLWIDLLRRRKRISDDPHALHHIADGTTPEKNLLREEGNAILYECIQRLPDSDQELLVLHYFSNLQLKEIARMLGATPGSIKTRMFRARKNLKQIIEESGYDI